MAFIESTWKITLAGAVVLNYGDLLEAELEIVPSSVVQEVRPIRASFSKRFPRGQVSHEIQFTKITQFASDAAVKAGKLAAIAALQRQTGNCLVEILDTTAQFTLAEACLAQGSGRCRIDAARLYQQFTIIGGQLSDTTPPAAP